MPKRAGYHPPTLQLNPWPLALMAPLKGSLNTNQTRTKSNTLKQNTVSLKGGEKNQEFWFKRNTTTCTNSQGAFSPFDSECPLHQGHFQAQGIHRHYLTEPTITGGYYYYFYLQIRKTRLREIKSRQHNFYVSMWGSELIFLILKPMFNHCSNKAQHRNFSPLEIVAQLVLPFSHILAFWIWFCQYDSQPNKMRE